jgi:hypothetical protein
MPTDGQVTSKCLKRKNHYKRKHKVLKDKKHLEMVFTIQLQSQSDRETSEFLYRDDT